MEDFIWSTPYPHSCNTETMSEYLNEHLTYEFELLFQDGSYAEVIHYPSMRRYGLHASGRGDFFNHKVKFEFLHED